MKKSEKKRNRRFPTILLGIEKDYFAENLSMLLSAGIGVSEAISIMGNGATEKAYKRVLSAISADLDEGSPFWKSIEGRGIMSASYIYLVKVGEASGRLPGNLTIVAKQQSKSKSFHSKLMSALLYPSVILSATVGISVGVIWFVIPKMAKIFGSMKIQLPLPTRIMISLGDFITVYPTAFLSIVVGFIAVIILIFFVPVTKRVGQYILFHMPRIRDLYKEVEVARFGFVMHSLADAGIPLVEALSSLEQSAELSPYKKFYRYLCHSVDEGNSLEKSFQKFKRLHKLIPVNIQQMISAGERSGNLTDVLGKISEIYEEKIELTSKNLTVILEPLLLFVVALGVLFLALAVVMPIYGLVGGLNGQ